MIILYRLREERYGVRILTVQKCFCIIQRLETGYGGLPGFYRLGNMDALPEDKAAGA